MRSQILSQILRRRILLAGCVALLLCVLRLALAAKPDAGITAIQQQALAEELAYQRAHDVTGLDEELLAPDDDASKPMCSKMTMSWSGAAFIRAIGPANFGGST